MSQVKASPTAAQTQFALQQQQQLDQEQFSNTTSGPVHRIMTRRASRSAQSHSTIPIIVKTPAEPENNNNHANDNNININNNNEDDDNNNRNKEEDNDGDISMDPTTPIPTDNINSRMTTRSRSIDLNQSNNNITYGASSAEESSNTSSTSQITKKRRTKTIKGKTKTKNRKRGIKTSSLSPPITTATTTKRRNEESLRGSRRRNAKDNNNNNNGAETTQLDAVKLKKLAELDELEKTILDGTHDEYRERMAHAETKRLNEMKNAKLRRDLEEADIRFTFEAFRKAAYDQFYQCKAELRKRMINQVQAQIKRSEEEWHTPSHENTGLKQEEILDDITAARSKIYITEKNN
ncbi:hypothetical protein INT45_004495 [Circinella minor]|uniref:Uncharacterized protein n=1 Tax=Circinella minor TaxID=1195481 RepID=A0A8H7S193_9FUNG|nr:hypothetical protein INT45_004495 [Circinella minor]